MAWEVLKVTSSEWHSEWHLQLRNLDYAMNIYAVHYMNTAIVILHTYMLCVAQYILRHYVMSANNVCTRSYIHVHTH